MCPLLILGPESTPDGADSIAILCRMTFLAGTHSCMYVSRDAALPHPALLTSQLFLVDSGFKFSQLESSKPLPHLPSSLALTPFCSIVEIVLAVLLSSFEFELTDKPVFWNQAPVMYPSMSWDGKPELQLNVKALKS